MRGHQILVPADKAHPKTYKIDQRNLPKAILSIPKHKRKKNKQNKKINNLMSKSRTLYPELDLHQKMEISTHFGENMSSYITTKPFNN